MGEPLRQPLKLGGEGAELVYRLRVTVGRDGHEMAVLTAVDPGCVGLDALEQRGRDRLFFACVLVLGMVLHHCLSHIGVCGRRQRRGYKGSDILLDGITPSGVSPMMLPQYPVDHAF